MTAGIVNEGWSNIRSTKIPDDSRLKCSHKHQERQEVTVCPRLKLVTQSSLLGAPTGTSAFTELIISSL